MKKCFMILTFLLIGFVFAGHRSTVPSVHSFTQTVVSINKTLEINNNDTFNLKNITTDISNSDYSLRNHNKKIIHIPEVTPDFVSLESFFLNQKTTLTFNSDFCSNPYNFRYEINPRAP
mgnify:FL=1|jgi:hypothetical protein